jgi:hypothetical protein
MADKGPATESWLSQHDTISEAHDHNDIVNFVGLGAVMERARYPFGNKPDSVLT